MPERSSRRSRKGKQMGTMARGKVHEIGDGKSRQRGTRKSDNNATGTRFLIAHVGR